MIAIRVVATLTVSDESVRTVEQLEALRRDLDAACVKIGAPLTCIIQREMPSKFEIVADPNYRAPLIRVRTDPT